MFIAPIVGVMLAFTASVFPTYSMGIMLLATYVKPYNGSAAYAIWIVGILIHIALIIRFSKRFIKEFNMKQVFPSYSGFTFPLVISALALKLSNVFLINQGVKIPVLPVLVQVEEMIAIIIVFYVLIRYLGNLKKSKAK